MLKKFLLIVMVMTTQIISDFCAAENIPKCYSNLSQVMRCFMEHQDGAYYYVPFSEIKSGAITVKTYILDSQKWPINEGHGIERTTWQHKLSIYIPDKVLHNTAMLYVTGGHNRDINGVAENFSKPIEVVDLSSLAANNNAIVISLENTPNQFLSIDGQFKKEDQIMAYTYKKVMENPMENAYLAGHLPMVKAIIKGMDASQEILATSGVEIIDFILAGASKRGWAVWLAALEDDRVSAIIPVVIDILNVPSNIKHICESYKNYCPPALRDYKAEGIIDHIDSYSKPFHDLMIIDDPLSYLNNHNYASRFTIPKYIVNAAGDDFYAPDSSKFYFDKLPGDNYIRYLPRAMHYFSGNAISNFLNNGALFNKAINSYFDFHLHDIKLPKVLWSHEGNKISIDSSMKPIIANLWTANNELERDFRFLNSYSKPHLAWKVFQIFLAKYLPISPALCDNCYTKQEVKISCSEEDSLCHIDVDLPEFKKGWQASFVELYYDIDGKEFITTTEINITPDTYP